MLNYRPRGNVIAENAPARPYCRGLLSRVRHGPFTAVCDAIIILENIIVRTIIIYYFFYYYSYYYYVFAGSPAVCV